MHPTSAPHNLQPARLGEYLHEMKLATIALCRVNQFTWIKAVSAIFTIAFAPIKLGLIILGIALFIAFMIIEFNHHKFPTIQTCLQQYDPKFTATFYLCQAAVFSTYFTQAFSVKPGRVSAIGIGVFVYCQIVAFATLHFHRDHAKNLFSIEQAAGLRNVQVED